MAEDTKHAVTKSAKAPKDPEASKAKKMADPVKASIDTATQEMIARAQELGIETVLQGRKHETL